MNKHSNFLNNTLEISMSALYKYYPVLIVLSNVRRFQCSSSFHHDEPFFYIIFIFYKQAVYANA